MSVFSFPDNNLSKYQWIFTKAGMSINIVEIWFGIANWQISSVFFTELSAHLTIVVGIIVSYFYFLLFPQEI